MTIDQFAKIYRHNGISVPIDEVAKGFANAWAQVVLGDYLMGNGEVQFNRGKDMLKELENQHPFEANGGLIVQ